LHASECTTSPNIRSEAALGDYRLASTPALHELAAAVVSHGGFPFAAVRGSAR